MNIKENEDYQKKYLVEMRKMREELPAKEETKNE